MAAIRILGIYDYLDRYERSDETPPYDAWFKTERYRKWEDPRFEYEIDPDAVASSEPLPMSVDRLIVQDMRAKRAGVESTLTPTQWFRLLDVFEHRCAYCRVGGRTMYIEHVVPIRWWGANVLRNVVPSCKRCNSKKKDSTLTAFCLRRGFDLNEIRARIDAAWDRAEGMGK